LDALSSTENQGSNLFSIPISYGANQKHSQTLDPPSRDQLKEPKTKHTWKKITRSLATAQTESLYSSLLKVGTKR